MNVCELCGEEYNNKNKRFCSSKCYHKSKFGEGNPFFNKTHSKETRKKLSDALKGKLVGEKNPFFGKTHTEEAKRKSREKNRLFRENNKELVEERKLKRLNLTIDKIREIYLFYCSKGETRISTSKKFSIDFRTIRDYIIKYNIATEEEINKVAFNKKYKNSTSKGEEILNDLLVEAFGEKSIKRQFKLDRYYYDFLLNDKIIVEYDGYYWHKIVESNDEIKNKVAASNDYPLYRVEEDCFRNVDFESEIIKIKGIYETYFERDKKQRKREVQGKST